jgi:hypothetical protein
VIGPESVIELLDPGGVPVTLSVPLKPVIPSRAFVAGDSVKVSDALEASSKGEENSPTPVVHVKNTTTPVFRAGSGRLML